MDGGDGRSGDELPGTQGERDRLAPGGPPAPTDGAGAGEVSAGSDAVGGASEDPPGAVPPASPRRPAGARALTLLLAAALLLVAAFAGFQRPQRHVTRVGQALPPVVQPTGQLAAAYRTARQASLRIEARCGPHYGNEAVGIGSGFFIRSDGTVLTAYHVVDASEQGAPCPLHYVAITPERLQYRLTLVGFDAYHDLAVLHADVRRAVPAIALQSALPRPGTKVVAIGNSRDQFLQPRAGEVTRLGVHAGRPDFADNTIELTTSLAPGDSGGPVVDAAGRAIGVVSYISFDPGAMASSHYVPPFLRGVPLPHGYASYAVPVGGSDLVAKLEAGERRDVPVVGFTWRPGFDYDPRASDVYLGPHPGVIVWQVQPGGPADRAGLRGYREGTPASAGKAAVPPRADVITAVDGTPTPTFYDLLARIRKMRIGQTVTLSVERGNSLVEMPLRLGAERSVFTQR